MSNNLNNHLNKLYDIEDDIIDRGDATNVTEALSYYNIEDKNDTKQDLNQKIEQDYHNTYYNKGSYGTRTLKLANKDWHKLNKS